MAINPRNRSRKKVYSKFKKVESPSQVALSKFEQSNWDGAIESYSSLIESGQGDMFKNYVMRGRSYFAKGMNSKAWSDYTSAINLGKKSMTFKKYSEPFYWRMLVFLSGADVKQNRDGACQDFLLSFYYRNEKSRSLENDLNIKSKCTSYLPAFNKQIMTSGSAPILKSWTTIE